MSDDPEILFEGRHMVLLRRKGWEYLEHRTAPQAAMIRCSTMAAFTAWGAGSSARGQLSG